MCRRPRSALLLVLFMHVSTGAALADATAVKTTSAGELIPGTSAQGQIGDYLMANSYVRVIIDDIPNPHGFATTGGNVIDAATATGEDRFASLFTMFNNSFGRQASYATIAIVNGGGGASTAQVRCTGVDSHVPTLLVQTDYFLGPNDRSIRIETTLTNTDAGALQQLQLGDAIQWGLTTRFAPDFDTTPYTTIYGGRIGLGDVSADGPDDLLAGKGRDPAATSTVTGFRYTGATLLVLPGSFTPFGAATYGVSVAGGRLGL